MDSIQLATSATLVEKSQLATSAKLVETDATGTANATGTAIQSSFVSSFQFVSSFVSSQIAFRNKIRYHWMCIPFILLRFEQFENESSEYHWMCIPTFEQFESEEYHWMCSADAQQALEGRRAAVAPRAWNRAAPVARPAQRPGAKSARRPADARRSDARPSQRQGARSTWRRVESVENAEQLTCSCCSRCADEAQSIGRRNSPRAGWESQSRPRRSSRPRSGTMALSCDNALQQIAEASEAAEPKDAIDSDSVGPGAFR